ncbi:MAG: cupin-like domain-containing protein [Solirubrobacteraceae bacterium]|nr:cupin-like domain-containing protein [Solirubrobacteraceae bacterium]
MSQNPADHDAATAGPSIAPEWQRWVAENALRGNPPEAIVKAMQEGGIDAETAAREVEAALRHPYLLAANEFAKTWKPPVQASSGGGSARADKYAWILEVSRRAAKLSSEHGTVPRVTSPSKEAFLEDFYARNRPCVIEGDMADWPAIERWDADYLKAGGRDALDVAVEVYLDREGPHGPRAPRVAAQMRFGDVVDAVEGGGDTNGLYMTANTTEKNQDLLRDLWADIAYPDYLDADHTLGKGLLWYGPKGTITPIHHDLTNNLMAQVRGRKHIKLIAPNETADVYNHLGRYSDVDIEHPDLSQFPAFDRVTVLDVEIGPGEMLFVPAGWWHGVRSLDTSITFTFMNFAYETDFYSFYTSYDEID